MEAFAKADHLSTLNFLNTMAVGCLRGLLDKAFGEGKSGERSPQPQYSASSRAGQTNIGWKLEVSFVVRKVREGEAV
jgi:hypothetical protein